MLLPPRWASEFCRGLAIRGNCKRWATLVCTAVICALPTFASDSASTVRKGKPLRIAADVQWIMGISSTDFFADYRYYLSGTASGFDVPIGITFSASSFQIPDVPIGIRVGYYRAAVRETYDYVPENRPQPIGPAQSLSQTITLTCVPALLTIDYRPQQRQFTGYVGLGVGVGAAHVYWNESVSTSTEPGARQGGVRYDEWHAAPAVQATAGIFLGFDQVWARKTRPGIFFEAGYLWMPITGPFFSGVAQTIPVSDPGLYGNYTIVAGGIVLRVGFEIIL